MTNFQATVSSYALGSHQRHSLPLPDVHLFLTAETESEVPLVSFGAFGYTAHTRSTIFWIAGRSYRCDRYESCALASWRVYAAPL